MDDDAPRSVFQPHSAAQQAARLTRGGVADRLAGTVQRARATTLVETQPTALSLGNLDALAGRTTIGPRQDACRRAVVVRGPGFSHESAREMLVVLLARTLRSMTSTPGTSQLVLRVGTRPRLCREW